MTEAGYPNGFETELWSAYNYSTAQKVTQFLQQQLGRSASRRKITLLEAGSARRESGKLAGPGNRSRAAVLRGVVVVDGRSGLGDCDRCSVGIVPAEAIQHRVLQERAVDSDIKRRSGTTDRSAESQVLHATRRKPSGPTRRGRRSSSKSCVGAQQASDGRLCHAGRFVQFHRMRSSDERSRRGGSCLFTNARGRTCRVVRRQSGRCSASCWMAFHAAVRRQTSTWPAADAVDRRRAGVPVRASPSR